MKPNTFKQGSISVEDTLLDLLALIKFGLHQIEHSEPQGFMQMKSEWCTMMYLLKDKAEAAYDTAGHLSLMSIGTIVGGIDHERAH